MKLRYPHELEEPRLQFLLEVRYRLRGAGLRDFVSPIPRGSAHQCVDAEEWPMISVLDGKSIRKLIY